MVSLLSLSDAAASSVVLLQNMFVSLEQRFNLLLSDEDNDKPEFLVPELPKPKKDLKVKRSSRTLRVYFHIFDP